MDESCNTKLGFEIKQARLAANLSQEQLAELLNVDRTYISFLESGKRSPSLETFIQLLNHLDIKLSFLPYEWLQKLYSVCSQYNLEIETLADTINDPKVIPMLRGKAFEFTACNIIRNNLPKNKYNDQYVANDFDFVITSIANAFYETEEETGLYYWSPSQEAKKFLKLLGVENQEEAFYKTYIARSQDLVVDENNNVRCSRKKCNNQNNCGFIPNYPYIYFNKKTGKVIEPWIEVEKFQQLLNN